MVDMLMQQIKKIPKTCTYDERGWESNVYITTIMYNGVYCCITMIIGKVVLFFSVIIQQR